MVLNPDILRKAQGSVDCVCGDRLPGFGDFDSLPYVHALVMECLRWYPVASLSEFPKLSYHSRWFTYFDHKDPPHTCTQDDVYNGYYVPKGSIMIANIW